LPNIYNKQIGDIVLLVSVPKLAARLKDGQTSTHYLKNTHGKVLLLLLCILIATGKFKG